ncbi:MAG: hypothetical protein ABSF45_13120 [Terriglobia bacterium]|jgi:hypothetical protein
MIVLTNHGGNILPVHWSWRQEQITVDEPPTGSGRDLGIIGTAAQAVK